MERDVQKLENLMENSEPLLRLLERAVNAEKPDVSKASRRVLDHPPRQFLQKYIQCSLDETAAGTIRTHLADCSACACDVLRLLRFEKDAETARQRDADWLAYVKHAVKIPEKLIAWISPLWQPQWAGAAVTAADIPEQQRAFQTKEGEIDINCLWRPPSGKEPAYIQILWSANLVAERELWALFFDPDTKNVLAEIPLGAQPEGGKSISSAALGFDPSNNAWAISILLKEPNL